MDSCSSKKYSTKSNGSVATRPIILAPSLLHRTTPSLLAAKIRLKNTEDVLVAFLVGLGR
jgi:hypothetical protein